MNKKQRKFLFEKWCEPAEQRGFSFCFVNLLFGPYSKKINLQKREKRGTLCLQNVLKSKESEMRRGEKISVVIWVLDVI